VDEAPLNQLSRPTRTSAPQNEVALGTNGYAAEIRAVLITSKERGSSIIGRLDMKKKLPAFKTNKEAEDFLDHDLSEYIHAENFAPFVFEYQPKQESINPRISEQLLRAVRRRSRA
jgi:predicted DNA binding CopG/RHH family protein